MSAHASVRACLKVQPLWMDSLSVGLVSGAGTQRLRSRFTLLSRFAPRVGLVTFRQKFVRVPGLRRERAQTQSRSMPVGLVAFACFDLGDGGFE
jgi:hypothetical protein